MEKYICENCGSLIKSSEVEGDYLKGCLWTFFSFCLSFIIAIFFNWLLAIIFLIVFLIIMIIRFQKKICPSCKSQNIIPINTPRGIELYNKYNSDEE